VAYVEPAPLRRMIAAWWKGGTWSFTPLGSEQFKAEAPSLAASGAGTVHVFGRALSGFQVKHRIFNEATGWSQQWVDTSSNGIATGSVPVAVAVSPNTVELYGRGDDAVLYQNSGSGPARDPFTPFTWTGWSAVTTPTTLASAPAVISSAPRLREVFYYQTNSGAAPSLRHLIRADGGSWSTDPAAFSVFNANVNVRPVMASFARGTWGAFLTRNDGSVRMAQHW